MQTVLVIRVEAVVVEIDRDDVGQRQLVHDRQRMARSMKDERNQRQRLPEPERDPRFGFHPLRFCPFGFSLTLLPDFDLIRPPGFFTRHESQHPELFHRHRFKRIGFHRPFLTGFPKNKKRQDIPTVHTFCVPVQDLFGGVEDTVGTLFGLVFPIHQRSSATNGHDFTHDIFRVGRQRRALHVGVFHETSERPTDTSIAIGKFESRFTTEDQSNETIGSASSGVKERRPVFVGGKFRFGLRVEARQIPSAGGLHRVLARKNVTRTQPRGCVCVVIGMCGIDRHARTVARVFCDSRPPLMPATNLHEPRHHCTEPSRTILR